MENLFESSGSCSNERKVAANRANAQHSTGPRTSEGKAKSSLNAIKYGFFSKTVLLPGEDPHAYESLREELWSSLCPQNAMEAMYVREIIDTHWRLQRLQSVEAAVFTRRSLSFTGQGCGTGFAFINDDQGHATFSHLGAYEAPLARRLHRALEQLRKVREKGWSDPVISAAESSGPMAHDPQSIAEACVETPLSPQDTLSNQQATSVGPCENHDVGRAMPH